MHIFFPYNQLLFITKILYLCFCLRTELKLILHFEIPINNSFFEVVPKKEQKSYIAFQYHKSSTNKQNLMWICEIENHPGHVMMSLSMHLSFILSFLCISFSPLFQAKIVHVWLDGQQLSPDDGYLIRKGPGKCFFDFAQDISFCSQTDWQAAMSKHNSLPYLRVSGMALCCLPMAACQSIWLHKLMHWAQSKKNSPSRNHNSNPNP